MACGGAIELPETSRDAQALDGPFPDAMPVSGAADATSALDAPHNTALDAGADASAGTDAALASRDATTADDAYTWSDGPAVGTDGLPSTAECLTGGHVLWVQGDPGCFWFTGTQRYALGSSWFVEAERYYATYDGAYLVVGVPASTQSGGGDGWRLNFNTWNVKQPMRTGVVYDALAVTGQNPASYNMQTCASAYGTFRVDEFRAVGGTDTSGIGMLLSFTAAFSLTCKDSTGVLRGCVHF
jgi:hypothetical protein